MKASFLPLSFLLLMMPFSSARSEEFVELRIPLEEGRYVTLQAFCGECNRVLGSHFDPESVGNKRIELTRANRVALRAVNLAPTKNLQVEISPETLTLRLPNRENEQQRRKIRRWLGKILEIDLDKWPESLGLHRPETFDPQQRSVLFIHGLESNAKTFEEMSAAFQKRGIQILTFDCPNDGPIAWSGDRLRDELSELHRQFPQFRCAIVAHSMGGLVARYALETPDKNPECITDLVTLGTPHTGSNLAGGQIWVELAAEGVPRRRTDWKTIRDGLGEAGRDLKPESVFLKELNSRQRASGVRYHCAAGTRGYMSDEQYEKIVPDLDGYLTARGIPKIARSWLVESIRRSPELRTGHGDGVVSIESAKLEGADSVKCFELKHRQLVNAPHDGTDSEVTTWIFETLGWSNAK